MRQLYIPIGFAHGFCVTSDVADVVYKCSWYYIAETESGIKYDDPDVGIEWPAGIELQPSQRDIDAPLLRDVKDELPFEYSVPR
jgi:dTDP-4-dehydrorhamnose 3,5-epimerase